MTVPTPEWQGLLDLLGPVHDDAQLFARRIARSTAEGDDLFQEAVLRAAVKLRLLRDPARFRAWFHSVIVSVHRSRCRKAWFRRWAGDDEFVAAVPSDDDGSRWIDQRASADRASRALATLRPAQREAIVLFELHGHSLEEIADIQRTSLSAVKSRLVRGRERLRKFYAELEPELDRAAPPERRAMTSQEGCHG